MKTWFSSDFIKFHQSSSKKSRFWKKNELNFDEIWWKHGFSSNFIKVHQKNQGFEIKNELWWNLMKFDEMEFDENMVFHQISFHQISSKKSRFWNKKWTLMKFDEIWWKHGFPSNFKVSSNFIKVHQSSSKFIKTKFIWKKCNNQWLKPDLDLQHLEKVEINVTNDCWTLVLVLNLYVLYVCLVSNTNLFWFGKYWKTRVLLK